MAAPVSKTLKNLSGKYKLNKELSDDHTAVLELQGVNFLIRKAISPASVHLTVSQPSENEVNMEQTATAASIPGTTEQYILDWEWRKNHDAFFGDIEGRSRWVSQDEARKTGTKGEWVDEGDLIQAEGKNPDWIATHFWGFEIVGGERRHTRRVHIRRTDGKEMTVRMVYDFVSE